MSKITALYLGCEVNDWLWVPVRKMVWQNEQYRVGYVGGVKQIAPAGSPWRHYFRPEGFEQVKQLPEVHCDFAPRMPLDRPQEMKWYLPSLGLPEDLEDPVPFVARTGGYRHTDTLDAFPEVEPDADGCYRFYFLLRKIHLIQPDLLDLVQETDFIESDDWWAVHQSSGNKIGVLPGYIRSITIAHPDSVELRIHQVSHIPLLKHRFLCSATCKGFIPFATREINGRMQAVEISNQQAFATAAEIRPMAASVWLEKLRQVRSPDIIKILAQIPTERMSGKIHQFIVGLLGNNIKQLQSNF